MCVCARDVSGWCHVSVRAVAFSCCCIACIHGIAVGDVGAAVGMTEGMGVGVIDGAAVGENETLTTTLRIAWLK